MKVGIRRSRPFWQMHESRPVRPEPWLIAAAVTGILLVEVWQSSRVAELSLALDRSRSALAETRASVTPEMEEEYRRLRESLKREHPRGKRIGFAFAGDEVDTALPPIVVTPRAARDAG